MGTYELIQKFIDLRPLPELKKALDMMREMKKEPLQRNKPPRKPFFKYAK